ncbi:lycopene cyclase domain-containing protein [Subtercola frigoramans]|uniref:Lycopene cyclase domain-containing protein n=1 Tax=Subtercola frigoramans TaxID=120298 RepID=A0ABS2L918_9MICO|nr:lycopene cyclase domain-containing protein [Subtercola frigoramans]MBM7473593.1 lycopene cyclase domain-containing protein [Subtercola frigoramans]
MTYWALNAFFLAVAVVLFAVARIVRRKPAVVPVLVTLAVLLVITAVFDNVMIGIGLVGYNQALISGAFIGIAPLEDFAYAIGAAVLLPALWMLMPARAAARPPLTAAAGQRSAHSHPHQTHPEEHS